MQKLHFSILINAPKKHVWHVMLDDATYREWTAAFMPGSYFEGAWAAGSPMRFLAPDADGTVSGMLSEIKEVRPFEFVSIRNLGEVQKGQDILWTAAITGGQELLENYTYNEKNGATELWVDVDSADEYAKMFEEMWPKALAALKTLAEK